jgi:hydroxymethylpyrimidine pyrophosphatase-like HAD family hydrolase
LFRATKKLLKLIRDEIEGNTGARWIEMEGEPAGIISQSDEEMEWIVNRVQIIAASEPRLGWQRNSIYLRFGHRNYQKGSSLSEIARIHSLGPAACFAIGDSHNDFEMLDPEHARMAACPGNAVDAIKAKIAMCGGYQANASHAYAAIEALRHFFPVPVSSD